jgi:glycosyltransferase involved in cell wall biosynthesis
LCDAVVDGESGRLVTTEDADAWTDALEQWLSHPAPRIATGYRARKYVAKLRGWETIIDAYEELFIEVAASRKRDDDVAAVR